MAMQDSQNSPRTGSTGSQRKKRLILGGRTYTIDDDDISVISPTNDKSKDTEVADKSKDCQQDSISEPKIPMTEIEGNKR